MDSIVVKGGGALSGQIPIAGAKNACLTLMPATLLSEEPLTLTNAPRLSDIRTMTELLRSLGAEVTSMQDGQVLAMSCHGEINTRAARKFAEPLAAAGVLPAALLQLGPDLGAAILLLPLVGEAPLGVGGVLLGHVRHRLGVAHDVQVGSLPTAAVRARTCPQRQTESGEPRDE